MVVAPPVAVPKKQLLPQAALEYMRAHQIDAWVSFQFSDKVQNDAMAQACRVPKGLTTATVSIVYSDWREPVLIVATMEAPKQIHFNEYGEVVEYGIIEEDLPRLLAEKLKGCKKIAMECGSDWRSSNSMVPAWFKELVQQKSGAEIVPSVGIINEALVEASPEALAGHREAVKKLEQIFFEAYDLIKRRVEEGNPITEYDLGDFIMRRYGELGMETAHNRPIVAVNEHIADVHYEAKKDGSSQIGKGDVVLLDIWAKNKGEQAAYADLTRMCFVGKREKIPEDFANAFGVMREAVEKAIVTMTTLWAAGKPLVCETIDAAARDWIIKRGYHGFPHSTGHHMSAWDVHGIGPRLGKGVKSALVPGSISTIEPGIYEGGGAPGSFGARIEVDFFLNPKTGPELTSQFPKEIDCLY